MDKGDAAGRRAIGGSPQAGDGRASQADHALELEGGEDVVIDLVAVLALEAGVKGSKARGEEDGGDGEGVLGGLHVEVDGAGGTGVDAGAAAGADVHIDEPGVGDGAEAGRAVDGLDGLEPALIVMGAGFGADGGALGTAGAEVGVDVAGFVAEGGGEVTGMAVEAEEGGVGQEVEEGVEVALEGGAEGGLVREHEAEAAGVGGEGVVEEVEGAADGGRRVEEVDGNPELGEVEGGGHAGDAGADDEDRVVWMASRRGHGSYDS